MKHRQGSGKMPLQCDPGKGRWESLFPVGDLGRSGYFGLEMCLAANWTLVAWAENLKEANFLSAQFQNGGRW